MAELDDGRTLALTILLSIATIVVLDKVFVIPMTRLWCLITISRGAKPNADLVRCRRCSTDLAPLGTR